MAAVIEEKPNSFLEYVAAIEKYQHKSPHGLWFRGTNDATHTLLPTLFRHKGSKTAEQFSELEKKLMLRFKQRSIPFLERPIDDIWDRIFVMQHYGFPTRLLDWSENPFVSLFFAVVGGKFKATGRPNKRVLRFEEDCAVWILDPMSWNHQVLEHRKYTGDIPFSEDAVLNGYKPPLDTFDDRNAAVAMNGAHNSPRIVAQRGAFTIFGANIQPMETVHDQRNFLPDTLIKIVIGKALIPDMRRAITNHGFTESVVFPGLDGLAKETKRDFGFED